MINLHQLSYPVGIFAATASPSSSTRAEWQQTLADFPTQLRAEVAGLSEDKLEVRYRPGGWTIRQVVHHCADSHVNALIRFKLALTEEKPTIKPYVEAAWAELADYDLPIETSLTLIDSVHQRWIALLNSMTEAQYQRTFFHPEHGQPFTLLLGLDTYQWHCRHHLAHVRQAKAKGF